MSSETEAVIGGTVRPWFFHSVFIKTTTENIKLDSLLFFTFYFTDRQLWRHNSGTMSTTKMSYNSVQRAENRTWIAFMRPTAFGRHNGEKKSWFWIFFKLDYQALLNIYSSKYLAFKPASYIAWTLREFSFRYRGPNWA